MLQAFTSSVNSPLKPPTQNTNKDSAVINGVPGRRTSVSQAQSASNNYTGGSPSSRPGTRRRESSDVLQSSNPLASPSGNGRFFRDEPNVSTPPPSLLRRRTDLKEGGFGPSLEEKETDSSKPNSLSDSTIPFGNLKRTFSGPVSADPNGPSSPWSATPQSAGFSPMGAFGNFALDSASGQSATAEKKPGFSSLRGESRFKNLMSTEKSEETRLKIKEKASLTSLEKLTETTEKQPSTEWETSRSAQPSLVELASRRHEEDFPIGSAALGGDDASPPHPQPSRFRAPDRQASYDDIGFSPLGMSSDLPPFRETMQRRDCSQQNTAPTPNRGVQSNEPMSPTNTNPYQSPEGERAVPQDFDHDDSDLPNARFQGAGQYGYPPRTVHSQFDNASDRSRTSSVGAQRPFPNLGPLGGLGGLGAQAAWSAAPGAVGTPSKAIPGFSTGFADSIFNPLGDLNSPSQGGQGTSGLFSTGGPSGNLGAIGRGSKIGSLFPNAMQEQMRAELRQEQGHSDGSESYQRHPSLSSAPGMGLSMRDAENSSRLGRGMLDDIIGNLDIRSRGTPGANSSFTMSEIGQMTPSQVTSMSSQTAFSSVIGAPSLASTTGNSYFGRIPDHGHLGADPSQMPATQQRQMVMPDRMRWIYRDPQGNTQGPWSGLEMHDWYKAGFFSPELQVKKLEDADYEPLAQLIRRIGNSREPFLVPQIGIPHGSAGAMQSSNPPASGSVPVTTPSAAQSSSAQPPFASSFPSFGTTLTAEQQNALERRKQEEQFLMARQKEHLAQQQVMLKQMQHMQGGAHSIHGQQLHHHSSAHSLQSQPSYGSITSPTGYQPSPAQGPIQPQATVPGFFDPLSRNAGSNLGPLGVGSDALSSVREDEPPGFMERMNAGRGNQLPFTGLSYNASQQDNLNHQQQMQAILQERARLQREQEQYEGLQRGSDENRVTAERYEQYHQLRSQMEEQQRHQHHITGLGQAGKHASDMEHQQRLQDHSSDHPQPQQAVPALSKVPEPLSMTEQVQKAAAKQSPMGQPQSPWAKVESGLPQPFPPPQSSSPLPAPAAQRNRSNVADALAAESRSASQTPSVETPSATIAPWAKETIEATKGPSLKEIQAIEARQAAQQDEIAAAARKALAEHERLHQPQPVAPAPGLPLSANWASGVSPAIPQSTGPSAWAKPVPGKPTVSTPTVSAKKTLAQIQKEEEARKHRAAAAAAAASVATNASSVATATGGKRYADLAGKAALPILQGSSSAWTTVGASGKVKTPTGPAPALANRTASTGIVQPSTTATKPKAPAQVGRSVTIGSTVAGQQNANEEFQKWARAALSKGLNPNIPGNILPRHLFHLKYPIPLANPPANHSRRLRLPTPHPPPRTRHHL